MDAGVDFEIVDDWLRIPEGIRVGNVTSVAVDGEDNVYLVNSGECPVIVLDRSGNFLRSWGQDAGFVNPHGAAMGLKNTIYITDDKGHAVHEFTLSGELLTRIGVPSRPAAAFSGRPFHRCTHTAVSPSGEIYVSDGYGNARIHKFTPSGELMLSWGESGTGPGQFNVAHNIGCDADGLVYVADRENQRVQIFDPDGNFVSQWNNLGRACALFVERSSRPLVFIGELPPVLVTAETRLAPNLGPRVTIMTSTGQCLARIGTGPVDERPGGFIAPHGIAVDGQGDIYVADISRAYWPLLFDRAPAYTLPMLHKLRRVR